MPNSSELIRVLVVDDQPIVVLGLRQALRESGFGICAVAADVRTLTTLADEYSPALVVIDTAMHNQALTLATLNEFVASRAVPVLAFTADISPAAVEAALENGCSGIVPKTATADALVAAVRAVAGGERHVHPRALSALLQRIQAVEQSRDVRVLSERELEVVVQIAEGQTNAAIAERLGISPATVKTHVEHVLHKLHAADRAQAVSRAMRLGLLQ